jgi:hypothetical protein
MEDGSFPLEQIALRQGLIPFCETGMNRLYSLAYRKENALPITRRQFDNSTDTLSAKVPRFPESKPDDAFELEQLAEAVGGRQSEVWAILDELKRRKQISGKCIKKTGYYCVAK